MRTVPFRIEPAIRRCLYHETAFADEAAARGGEPPKEVDRPSRCSYKRIQLKMNFNIREVARAGLLALALSVGIAPACVAATAGPAPGDDLAARLREAVSAYRPSAPKPARAAAADAFFAFEGSGLDRDLAAREPGLYRAIESEWMRLLDEMAAAAPADDVAHRADRVVALLDEGARASAAGGSVFFDSLVIILREGFEAILVVSALAAYLVRIGQAAQLPVLYAGAGTAVAASVALWLAARSLFAVSGAGREAFEGATMLLATGVLFWVSYWLVSKAEAARWQAFVRSRIERALGRGALFGFALLSFVVVFREGFETVLFYEALYARARGPSGSSLLVGGFAVGAASLVLLYVGFKELGPRIPLRAFFSVTSGLLYFMAFKFAGAGVRELQTAGVVSQTRVPWFPDAVVLHDWLGVYPYVEPLALQAVLLLLVVLALPYAWRRREPEAGVAAEPERRASAGRG